jgi:UDP-2,4-diacetamido-2,4,6-trideoxy-beta-L-altropyranose hydrolase
MIPPDATGGLRFCRLGMHSSVTKPPQVLFLADAGPMVGGGHVMRCLTLARALTNLGAHCQFMAPPSVSEIMNRFDQADTGQIASDTEKIIAVSQKQSADIVVIDHYGLGRAVEATLGQGRRLVVLDDLPGRVHACDLLLDPSLGRQPSDYHGLVPDTCQVLTGPAYALVRREFAALRDDRLAHRSFRSGHGPILVSLGLTDLFGLTATVVEALLALALPNPIWAVVGASAPSLNQLQALAAQNPQVSVLIESRDMAALMSQADLSIGAGGSSTWERACLGLPSLTLILADNQAEQTRRMAELGACLALDIRDDGWQDALQAAVQSSQADFMPWRQLGVVSSSVCDGLGAARVAEAILSL